MKNARPYILWHQMSWKWCIFIQWPSNQSRVLALSFGVCASSFSHVSDKIMNEFFSRVNWKIANQLILSQSMIQSNLCDFFGTGEYNLSTYIMSTLALVPCILPRIVPAFEFFTQPVMPSSSAFSRAHRVNEQPVEYEKYVVQTMESINHQSTLCKQFDTEIERELRDKCTTSLRRFPFKLKFDKNVHIKIEPITIEFMSEQLTWKLIHSMMW